MGSHCPALVSTISVRVTHRRTTEGRSYDATNTAVLRIITTSLVLHIATKTISTTSCFEFQLGVNDLKCHTHLRSGNERQNRQKQCNRHKTHLVMTLFFFAIKLIKAQRIIK
jgi:hypothetical protein